MSKPRTPEELAHHLLSILRSGDPIIGQEDAYAMIGAATTFLREQFGEDYALDTLGSFADAVTGMRGETRHRPSPAGLH